MSQLTYTWTTVVVIPSALLVDVLGRLRLSLALFFIEQCYKDRQNQAPDHTNTHVFAKPCTFDK